LSKLQTEILKGKKTTKKDISQLLWAARGRTPHYYKSKPWGMTIPVNKGKQNISTIYLISGKDIFEYSNWKKNNPTHSIQKAKEIEKELLRKEPFSLQISDKSIILAINEISDTALWEIGYQLINLIIQAFSLDLKYSIIMLNEKHRKTLKTIGINHAKAIFFI
jgi:hypothetical protein